MVAFKRFGWRHVELSVPEDWFLGTEGGTRGSGFFRLEDRYRPRLEITWQSIKFEKAPSTKKAFDGFIKNIEKRLSKAEAAELKVVSREEVSICGHDGFLGRLRSGLWIASAMTWYCEFSEKMFGALLTFSPSDPERELVERRIVESLRCHFPADADVLWSLYGVEVELPASFYLVKAHLTTGLSHAVFKHSSKNLHIAIAYSAMAHRLLKAKGGLSEIVNKDFRKQVVSSVRKFGRINVKKGEGGVYLLTASTFDLLFGKVQLMGQAWISTNDRMLIVSVIAPRKLAEEAERLLHSTCEKLRQRAGLAIR